LDEDFETFTYLQDSRVLPPAPCVDDDLRIHRDGVSVMAAAWRRTGGRPTPARSRPRRRSPGGIERVRRSCVE
jgi:hypothetical protein